MPQKSLNWDESKHPRDEIGEFAAAPQTKRETGMQVTPGPVTQPPRQTLMFDTNKTARLFDTAIFEAAKKQKKGKAAATGPSLLEQIEDDISKQAEENKPLGGQREMFARMFTQTVERYYRSSAMRRAIDSAASATDLAPSPEQKEAGNYSKGKFNWHGLIIAIENPKGSFRRGKNKAGKSWQVEMKCHYGYILRNVSEADGDHVDVFVGPHPESDLVCVVDQRTPGGHFDEHKVLVGFTSVRDARRAYIANYAPGWTGLESITAMTVPQFKQWLKRGDSGKRLAKQVSRYTRIFEQEIMRYAKPHYFEQRRAVQKEQQATHAAMATNKPDATPRKQTNTPTSGHWVTINGAAVFINGQGKTTKGPKALTGVELPKSTKPAQATKPTAPVAPLTPAAGAKPAPKPEQPATPAGNVPRKHFPTAYAYPMPRNDPQAWIEALSQVNDPHAPAWKNIQIPDDLHFAEWVDTPEPEAAPPAKGKSRKAAILDSAKEAADPLEIPVGDVLALMPEAHKYLKQEQADREKAKAALRKVSGLTAGSLARMENKYQDHSSVKGWDTTAREFAGNFPSLGYDPNGDDTPAEVWDFLREGEAPYIAAYDQKVAELAAEWAMPNRRTVERTPGDEDESHQQIELARSGEAVPFSRRATVAKFSRMFDRALARMRYSGGRNRENFSHL